MKFKCSAEFWDVDKAYVMYGSSSTHVLPYDRHLFNLPKVVTIDEAVAIAKKAFHKICGFEIEPTEVTANNDRIFLAGPGMCICWIACNAPIGD